MNAIRGFLVLGLLVELLYTTTASAQVRTAIAYKYANIVYPGALLTLPNAINNANTIVGSYFDAASNEHGFVFHAGKFSRIDFPGATATEAMGLNDLGDIVGVYQLPGPLNFHGFVRHNGAFTTLDDPAATFATRPLGINTQGTIVGSYDDAHGFIYEHGTYRTYDAPQTPGETSNTQLNSINNLGWIAGQVFTAGIWRGFWVKGDDLDFLEAAGANDSEALAVNGHGDVVGCHDTNSGFISLGAERSGEAENAEVFPPQQQLASCATGINYARAVVGIYFTAKRPYGFVGVPALSLAVNGPADHSSQRNPVRITATASGNSRISQIQVWLSYKQILHVNGATLNKSVNLPLGSNQRLVIQAVDSHGVTAKLVENVTIY